MSEPRNPVVQSEWTIEAEKALEAAQKMRPGEKRIEALRQAGKLRNEAILRDLAGKGLSKQGWLLLDEHIPMPARDT